MTTLHGLTAVRVGEKRRLGRSAPRSRSGCATCKRRKVRCDETTPICANCTRLGTECIYQRIPQRNLRSPTRGDTNGGTRSSLQNIVTEQGPVPGPSRHGDEYPMDPDSGVDSALYPENTLFFDFDAFSRNALDLWCSPSTALPAFQYAELSESLEISTIEHGTRDDTTSALLAEKPASFDETQYHSSASNREFSKAQVDQNPEDSDCQPASRVAPPSNNQDAHLLRDIVPCFKQMATNMLLAPYCTADNGTDDSIMRRSDALGVYFQEHVFVPAVTTVDTTSWRSLCCQILSMARKSSIVSNAVVALSQLHFIKFTQTEHHKGLGSQTFRNGQNLAQYLYIFAKESLVSGLDMLKSDPTTSLRLELLVALFLLTCFELIDKEDIHRAHQIEWADYLLQEFNESDAIAHQIINWLLLCDVKLVVLGGSGILPRKPPPVSPMANCTRTPLNDTNATASPLVRSTGRSELSPPPDRLQTERMSSRRRQNHPLGPVTTLKEGILRDAVHFHHQSQQFLRKIAMLDRHRRPRGSTQDEMEVTAAAEQLVNDLHTLWNERPAILDLDFEQLSQSLQVDLARDVTRTICIFRACFWSNFCYLYRAAWWNHSLQGDEKSAADETWRALRGSVDQPDDMPASQLGYIDVDQEPVLNTAAMWALFTFATECSDAGRVSWCISKLRQLSHVKTGHGIGGEHAAIHAQKAERLLQEVVDRQLQKGSRVDVRYVSLELFGFMFPII